MKLCKKASFKEGEDRIAQRREKARGRLNAEAVLCSPHNASRFPLWCFPEPEARLGALVMAAAMLIYTSSKSAPEHFFQGCLYADTRPECWTERESEHEYEKNSINIERKDWTVSVNLQ